MALKIDKWQILNEWSCDILFPISGLEEVFPF